MVKNLYKCEKCKAQFIAQAPERCVTPFFVKCRLCGESAVSSLYSLAQDVLADAHIEFVYDVNGTLTGSRNLRPVLPYVPSDVVRGKR